MKVIRVHDRILGVRLAEWGDMNDRGKFTLNIYPDRLQLAKEEHMPLGGYVCWYPFNLVWWPRVMSIGMHFDSTYQGLE